VGVRGAFSGRLHQKTPIDQSGTVFYAQFQTFTDKHLGWSWLIMISSVEYMIEWPIPEGYDSTKVLTSLPSPISRDMREIYNYCIKPNGFWVVDRQVNSTVFRKAMWLFLAEALSHTDAVTVRKLSPSE
jgi:hypothetical protein